MFHKSGKEILVADTLSRLHLKDTDDTHEAFHAKLYTVIINLPISDTKISEPQAKTKDDTIAANWNHPDWMAESKNCRDELKVIDGLVLKGERIVIPTAARRETLKRIYVEHMGIVKSKNRAKEAMFCPNMHSHIEDMVSNCLTCLQFRIFNPKERLILHDVPENQWQIVAVDLFQLDDEHYLIVVDTADILSWRECPVPLALQ